VAHASRREKCPEVKVEVEMLVLVALQPSHPLVVPLLLRRCLFPLPVDSRVLALHLHILPACQEPDIMIHHPTLVQVVIQPRRLSVVIQVGRLPVVIQVDRLPVAIQARRLLVVTQVRQPMVDRHSQVPEGTVRLRRSLVDLRLLVGTARPEVPLDMTSLRLHMECPLVPLLHLVLTVCLLVLPDMEVHHHHLTSQVKDIQARDTLVRDKDTQARIRMGVAGSI